MENSLLKKLQIKPGFKVNVLNAPANLNEILAPLPADVPFIYDKNDTSDGLFVFVQTKAELQAVLPLMHKNIDAKTICWIFYPKAKSKLAADLNLMKSWDDLKAYQLTPCASAAVNEIWTGLRIKPEAAQKKSGLGNAELVQSDFGEYIDVTNKKVMLPPDVKEVLEQHPEAFQFYEKLAYSHRKEYILWILTAKQEKTRTDRIRKMIEMLLGNKKNPSAK